MPSAVLLCAALACICVVKRHLLPALAVGASREEDAARCGDSETSAAVLVVLVQ